MTYLSESQTNELYAEIRELRVRLKLVDRAILVAEDLVRGGSGAIRGRRPTSRYRYSLARILRPIEGRPR